MLGASLAESCGGIKCHVRQVLHLSTCWHQQHCCGTWALAQDESEYWSCLHYSPHCNSGNKAPPGHDILVISLFAKQHHWCDRCDLAWSKEARHMYARLSTLSTSFSLQCPVGSFCRYNIISCENMPRTQRHHRPAHPITMPCLRRGLHRRHAHMQPTHFHSL